MQIDPDVRVHAVYSYRLGQWKICHTGPRAAGESSVIATILTSDNSMADEQWARLIASRFNAGAEKESRP